jgi:hypothetical protein
LEITVDQTPMEAQFCHTFKVPLTFFTMEKILNHKIKADRKLIFQAWIDEILRMWYCPTGFFTSFGKILAGPHKIVHKDTCDGNPKDNEAIITEVGLSQNGERTALESYSNLIREEEKKKVLKSRLVNNWVITFGNLQEVQKSNSFTQ